MQFTSLTPREVRRVSNGCLLHKHTHRELATQGGQEKHTVHGNDEEGLTSLHSAMSSGHANFVEALLQTGAHVYAVNYGEHTTLHYSVSKGQVKISQVLISNGANVKLKDEFGYTPLHQEARAGHP